ncbi:hypothetical protein [Pseudonocardia hydrocarbonoxydans]|jgi:hypothetical protein|uniref:DUF4878 domain-containing protein n=1 Tax=Pseudonocardia hydrocarbonoxydans TaxID=76726 RepID=A0A4Y3WHU0_9PSEU|nr:hypothetical protein [Pseudonocardia hydrocarbonoxydans]GEC18048.1 hypothetical protein PHY01_03310 [Pseudonocardia hydrocarbonoxydans]
MKTIRSAVAAAALAALLAGCSAGGPDAPAQPSPAAPTSGAAAPGTPSATAAPGAVGPEEAAVEAALRAYQQAIATQDWPIACALNAPETSAQLVAAVQAGGAQVGTCEEALAAVFGQPGAAEAAVEAAGSTSVEDVTVSGLNATIRWTSTRQGRARSDGATLQLIDGQWRLAGTA